MARNDRIRLWLLGASMIPLMSAAAAANQRPEAHAGADRTTRAGVAVVLDGSGSTDADGDSLSFSWSVSSAGVPVQIVNPNSVRPTVVLPAPGAYSIQLIVSDGTLSSTPTFVTLTTTNSVPVANAGPDQTVSPGSRVLLDGSKSTDVDGDALTYEWQLSQTPARSTATLLTADPANPSAEFIVDQPGRYVAKLTVRDADSVSNADATIVSTANSAPEADAGHDLATALGERVELSGGASVDADHDSLSYRWSLSKPAGSAATLSAPTGPNTGFVPDIPGSYVVQLIVNDGTADSAPDTVAVSTENTRPIAWGYAEVWGTPYVGDDIYLNGNYSYDPDGDAVTYQWSILSAPVGSTATIAWAQWSTGVLTPDVAGSYVVQLIVSDGQLNSDPVTAQVYVEVRPPTDAPVITLGPVPQFVNASPLMLTGSVNKPVSLWINGTLVALDASNSFTYPLALDEGINDIDIYAEDASGHSASLNLQVTLDTQVPLAPQLSSITVETQPDEHLIVRGGAGTAEPYTTVTITNVRTGETASAEVQYDGRFEVAIGGIDSDVLSVVVADDAQNASEATVVPGVGSGPLNVQIMAPLAGATIASNSVIVKGVLSGPADAGVSVNGQPAIILEDGWRRTFAALVALQPGTNTIVATAKRPPGSSVVAQLQVTSAGSTAFQVTARPASGTAPLNLLFEISEFSDTEIAQTTVDLQSDGSIDITNQNDNRFIPATYAQPGYYEAQIAITTTANEVVTAVVPVSVQTHNQLDLQIQRIWSAVRTALQAGDVTTAMTYFTADAAERYGPIFQQIGAGLPDLAAAFTDITMAKVSGRLVEYVLIREAEGVEQAFLVSFIRGSDGVWRVASL